MHMHTVQAKRPEPSEISGSPEDSDPSEKMTPSLSKGPSVVQPDRDRNPCQPSSSLHHCVSQHIAHCFKSDNYAEEILSQADRARQVKVPSQPRAWQGRT